MCSVVGSIGSQSKQAVLAGLSRLEYRGYDSAGYATVRPAADTVTVVKVVGSVAQLQAALAIIPHDDNSVSIGHTRWSTHGAPTLVNAHPHADCYSAIALVHNGIIENADSLRSALLKQGHWLQSETDSELIVHLLEDAFIIYHENPLDAVRTVAACLEGAFACLIIHNAHPNILFWMRSKSPLCVTFSGEKAYVASDAGAFPDSWQRVCYVPEKTVGLLTNTVLTIAAFSSEILPVLWEERVHGSDTTDGITHTYAHEMLKEIFEQKTAIKATIRALMADEQRSILVQQYLKSMTRLGIVGCGTSYHAGLIGKIFFETIACIPVAVHVASEFLYSPLLNDRSDMYLGISQSGETADTLESLRRIRKCSTPVVALTNTHNSSMVREADAVLHTYAGIERAVASTKAFSTQIAVLYWLAYETAYIQGRVTVAQCTEAYTQIHDAAVLLEEMIVHNKQYIDTVLAPLYAQYTRAIFLGRQSGYALAREAALKLQEISYIFAQACPAGELKHGPLALIDSSVPVFIFSSQDPILYRKLLSNVHEIKARGGHVCAIIFENQSEMAALADIHLCITSVTNHLLEPLVMAGVVQYLCYAIARELKRPIDKPRNLAKSVTVE